MAGVVTKDKLHPTFRAAPDAPAGAEIPEEVDEAPDPGTGASVRKGTEPMATAIKDGRPILLYPLVGEPVQAYRRTTRAFEGGAWTEKSVWSVWRGSNPVPFEPVGWTKMES